MNVNDRSGLSAPHHPSSSAARKSSSAPAVARSSFGVGFKTAFATRFSSLKERFGRVKTKHGKTVNKKSFPVLDAVDLVANNDLDATTPHGSPPPASSPPSSPSSIELATIAIKHDFPAATLTSPSSEPDACVGPGLFSSPMPTESPKSSPSQEISSDSKVAIAPSPTPPPLSVLPVGEHLVGQDAPAITSGSPDISSTGLTTLSSSTSLSSTTTENFEEAPMRGPFLSFSSFLTSSTESTSTGMAPSSSTRTVASIFSPSSGSNAISSSSSSGPMTLALQGSYRPFFLPPWSSYPKTPPLDDEEAAAAEVSAAWELDVPAGTLKLDREEAEAVSNQDVFEEVKYTTAEVAVGLENLQLGVTAADEDPFVPASPASPFAYICTFFGATSGFLGLAGGTTNSKSKHNAVSSPTPEDLEKNDF